MIVISDTSVITYLIQLDQVHLLKILFEEIIISRKVKEELLQVSGQEIILRQLDWIVEIDLRDDTFFKQLLLELDAGEAESIALALELKADLLLIDEKHGRKLAEKYGIRITGLLGILIKAKAEGLIDQVKPFLERLIYEMEFRIAPGLYQKVLRMVGE